MKKTSFLAIHKEAERVFNEVKWLNFQKSGTRQLHDATK
jgi:hypothetical protein